LRSDQGNHAHRSLSHDFARHHFGRIAAIERGAMTRRVALDMATATALGGLSALGFAPWSAWPVTLIALIGLIHWLASTTSARSAFLRGWSFGLGLGLVSLFWLVDAFEYQDSMPPALGWLALLLLAGYTALYWGAVSVIAVRLGRGTPLRLAIAFSALFVLGEWSRGIILTGFSWNPLGAIWVPVTPVLPAAATISALGLSGATSLAAGLAAAAMRGSSASITALVALCGAIMLIGRGSPSPDDTDQPISIVQANIGQEEKWRLGAAKRQIERHLALSDIPRLPPHRPRILFWPEAAVTLPIDTNPALRRRLVKKLHLGDLLVTGGIGQGGPRSATNSVFVLDSAGRIVGRYDKAHLVPFGEYLPLAQFLGGLGLTRLVPGSTGFEPGQRPSTLAFAQHKLGVAICYEIIFAAGAVDPDDRPQFIFNPSNDAWFGPSGPPQHLAQARLRAVEQGLPVVRATPTGISGVIRADGSVAARLPIGRAARLDAMLPIALPPTLFARWGDRIPLTLALLAFVAMLVSPPLPGRQGGGQPRRKPGWSLQFHTGEPR
jgi:apolipoprotein N-acyltransferase